MYNTFAQLVKLKNYKNFKVKIGPIPSALLPLSSIISATISLSILLLVSFHPSFQEEILEQSPDSITLEVRQIPKIARILYELALLPASFACSPENAIYSHYLFALLKAFYLHPKILSSPYLEFNDLLPSMGSLLEILLFSFPNMHEQIFRIMKYC